MERLGELQTRVGIRFGEALELSCCEQSAFTAGSRALLLCPCGCCPPPPNPHHSAALYLSHSLWISPSEGVCTRPDPRCPQPDPTLWCLAVYLVCPAVVNIIVNPVPSVRTPESPALSSAPRKITVRDANRRRDVAPPPPELPVHLPVLNSTVHCTVQCRVCMPYAAIHSAIHAVRLHPCSPSDGASQQPSTLTTHARERGASRSDMMHQVSGVDLGLEPASPAHISARQIG